MAHTHASNEDQKKELKTRADKLKELAIPLAIDITKFLSSQAVNKMQAKKEELKNKCKDDNCICNDSVSKVDQVKQQYNKLSKKQKTQIVAVGTAAAVAVVAAAALAISKGRSNKGD